MSIFVKGLDGRTFTIYVDQDYLIEDIRHLIDNKTGLHPSYQALIGTYMVKDHSIISGSTLHLVMNLRGC